VKVFRGPDQHFLKLESSIFVPLYHSSNSNFTSEYRLIT